ncbi:MULTISPECIES: MerR family transcriptional regulator [unclassified Micromonospora]|uniref:MerR family transcriptional regulator n=1 Tax=unclassified Micromonospora TaxID=2617518 RepID=UPI0022B73E47|nr:MULTISPECIES: MerR family transcriptional regulator [unclassified Micromonospora]MCZ7421545.1 MerR family transcriptional regulator [Verrucosispora sp. WMMA2121]WBB93768.1 MerR family transcriptional regulator [Verrucosispora sp. WMMC514]
MADEALSAGVVAQRLGVAVTTLRTWHQRYGLGPSEHIPGHHRRYTPADLARLEVMRRLTAEGVSPAEAARWARQAPDTLAAVGASRAVLRRRDGGGTTIPVGRAGPAVRGLARAAMRLDAAAIGETISRAIAADGVVTTWDRLLRPLLVGLGERHAATGDVIEVEHLVSRCVSAALGAVASAGPASGPPRVLLACADEEQHSLPLEALAAALAEAGVGYRMLGARVPVTALLAAVGRTGPAAVVLWSQTRATADPAQLTALLTVPNRPLLVLAAGPGWPARSLPVGVVRPSDLTEAVALTVAVHDSIDRPAAS